MINKLSKQTFVVKKKEKYQRKNNSILFLYIFISFLLGCVGKRKEMKQRKENRRRRKTASWITDVREKRGFPSQGHWVHFVHSACPSESAPRTPSYF